MFSGKEMLTHAQYIARDNNIEIEEVVQILEAALAISLRKLGADYRQAEFRVSMDRYSGDLEIYRRWQVIDDETVLETPASQIMHDLAQERYGEITEDGFVEEQMHDVDLSKRTLVQAIKQNLSNRLKDAERDRLLQELLSRKEVLLNGYVQRVDRVSSDLVVEVQKVECLLPRSETIPRESIRVGDRIMVMIKETLPEERFYKLRLTRTSPDFVVELFRRMVPEIEKGMLEIVKVVRDAGNRCKMAVRTLDPRIDPIGSCVGIRGSRVQWVTNEVNNERIDIIPWSEDIAQYVIASLAPAKINEIKLDEDRKSMDVIVDEEELAQVIGRNGVNVKLASDLVGWRLNLMSIEEYEQQVSNERETKVQLFVDNLDVQPEMASILFEEQFTTIQQIAYVDAAELLQIAGFDEKVAEELQYRAREYCEREQQEIEEKIKQLDESLRSLVCEYDEQWLVGMVKAKISNLNDLAALALDELLDDTGIDNANTATEMLLKARDIVYAEEDAAKNQLVTP